MFSFCSHSGQCCEAVKDAIDDLAEALTGDRTLFSLEAHRDHRLVGETAMSERIPWYVSLIVAWLPFIVLIGIGWYLGRQVRRGLTTKDGRSIADVMVEIASELKRQNERPNSR
jgi:ATP-dependent Zn protease